ncbi:uncharacterized protein E5676_scaffold1836G00120 [Cucumis melo var. makuwa]|uniref:Uncharacterized protein n=1 Tax=Cucumis melo var. makuwa TaxID=1194695 RepID=A0A5D3D7G8_CUCMM|nr:uncharacterized protein E5676_scaffold1836G00120 [Cucumis melo var. makuwa]
MQEDVVVTLCLLEKYFPPSFFTIMDALALEVPKNSITPSLRWIAHEPSLDVATDFGYMINGYYYHTKRRDDIRRVQNSGVSITATTMQVSSSKEKNSVISGVKVDELGFTIVDLKRIGTIEEDFFEDEIGYMLQKCGYGTIQRMPNIDTPNEIDDTTSTSNRHDCEGRWVEKEDWESFVDARLREEGEIILIFKGKEGQNVYTITTCLVRDMLNLVIELDELVATHKNEDILTDALSSKEHGGRVREEEDSRCKSDKKRSNNSRSSIESINIDLNVDEDLVNTPSNKGVEEHSTRKDVVYSSNYTDVYRTIKLLNRHVVKNMKDVDMICILMNKLIFRSDKFVSLAREDLLHYCGMVEIGYMCIPTYITVEDMASETRSTMLSVNSKMEKCKGCGYYVQKYIYKIVHNSSTSITSLFNTKSAYRQEEIDEI